MNLILKYEAIFALENRNTDWTDTTDFHRFFSFINDGFKKKIRENLLYQSNLCSHKIPKCKALSIKKTGDSLQIVRFFMPNTEGSYFQNFTVDHFNL
jgi:hypothetical protein